MPVFPTPDYHGRHPKITSGYGVRSNGKMHWGTDILYNRLPSDSPLIPEITYSGNFFHPFGLPALAAMSGRVLNAQMISTGGYVRIDHGGGWQTEYMHLKRGSLRVKPGDTVHEGEPIGEIFGSIKENPNGGLIHLHFQIRTSDGGLPVDPEPIITKPDWKHINNPWEIDLLLVLAVAAGVYILA